MRVGTLIIGLATLAACGDPELASCAEGAVAARCDCGGAVVTSSHCCADRWSPAECPGPVTCSDGDRRCNGVGLEVCAGDAWSPVADCTTTTQICVELGATTAECQRLQTCTPDGAVYHVATDGDDAGDGSLLQPWATLERAIAAAEAGDTVFIRGGTYLPTASITWHPPGGIGRDGEPGRPICYFNYPDEVPVFDFINAPPVGNYLTAFFLWRADYLYFRGLTIRNVLQQRDFVETFGIGATDSTNLHFENMTVHNVEGNAYRFLGAYRHPASGWPTDSWYEPTLTGYLYPEHADYPENLILFVNCDAYDCADARPRTSQGSPALGGAADGFKAYDEPGTFMLFDGCRAWNCSDDGIDAGGSIDLVIRNSWSFENGYLDGDGTGYKTGSASDARPELPDLVRRIYNNISAANLSGYFLLEYEGYRRTAAHYTNNVTFAEEYGFTTSNNANYPDDLLAVWRNNLGHQNATTPFSQAYKNLTESNNTWDWAPGFPGWVPAPELTVTDDDFLSLDIAELRRPRQPDGSLPAVDFMKLAPGSDLIGAGVHVDGYDRDGAGNPWANPPSIGAFEAE